MTKVDELTGRALDAAVHEALFAPVVGWAEASSDYAGGWFVDGEAVAGTSEPVYVENCQCDFLDEMYAEEPVINQKLRDHEARQIHGHYSSCLAVVPRYHDDSACEWPAVLDEMFENGWYGGTGKQNNGRLYAEFIKGEVVVVVFAETLAEAVCHAALRAVAAEGEDDG